MAKSDRFVVGDENEFHIEVRPEFGDDHLYGITIWPSNHGVGLTPSIRSFDVAVELAKHLYSVLLPEHVASQERYREMSRRLTKELEARPKPKPVRVPKNAPKIDVLICPECSELIPLEEISDERVYECGECGTSGAGEDARRCEQCNKFTAKVSETSCPECGAAMDEAEKTQAQRATNKELVAVALNAPTPAKRGTTTTAE